jgi:hypothetical protein
MSIKHFLTDSLVWVKFKGEKIKGKVLDFSDISTREHGYEVYKVELEKSYTGLDGVTHTTRWIHPEPIQGYKLTKRVQ